MIDLIIPTYKNKEGLRVSLQSIPAEMLEWTTVTVIDDASNISYHDILEDFPFIHYVGLTKNCGPGMVRQYGINHTCEQYIMFLDTGDYFLPVAEQIHDIIKQNPEIDIFSWPFKIGDKISKDNNNMLHGRVYKRNFLATYKICFSEQGSYANEDIGFNQLCRLVLSKYYPDGSHVKILDTPIIVYDLEDMNSITRTGNFSFKFKMQNIGMAYNTIHVYNNAKRIGVSEKSLNNYISHIMSSEYFYFIRTLQERPEYAQNMWDGARYYYLNLYNQFKDNNEMTSMTYSRIIRELKKDKNKNMPPFKINIYRFMNELEQFEQVPDYYFEKGA